MARWQRGIEAGNLYVNRHITGAIVRRQPFGGWKSSVVGPGAKAGGPNYVLQLGRWRQVEPPGHPGECAPSAVALLERCLARAGGAEEASTLRSSAGSYGRAWRQHFDREHDPSGLLGERNIFRYRRCRHVLVRTALARPDSGQALCQVLLAARTCGVPVTVSLPPGTAGWGWLEASEIPLLLEADEALRERLQGGGASERLRVWEPLSLDVGAAAHRAQVTIIDAPVVANGRLELRWYLREQAVSQVVHRYGSLIQTSGA